jgi:hypothetical protein
LARWRDDLLDAGVSRVTAAKAYRLLKAILATAVKDSLISHNPCRVKGAGTDRRGKQQPDSAERAVWHGAGSSRPVSPAEEINLLQGPEPFPAMAAPEIGEDLAT